VIALAGCGSSSKSSTTSSGGGKAALGPTFDDIGTLPGAQNAAPPWSTGLPKLRARLKAIGLQPLGQEGQALHIHQHLDIYVGGRHVTIPANVGIGPDFIAALHTHDTTGILHVESPTVADFTLGQFFAVWGVPLSAKTIGGVKGPVKAWVNGKPLNSDPTRIILASHQEIVLASGAAPKKIPSTYSFPEGL